MTAERVPEDLERGLLFLQVLFISMLFRYYTFYIYILKPTGLIQRTPFFPP